DGTQLDRNIRAVMAIAVDGRILPMFAFLFGYGMVQFARARAARGIHRTHIRRMLRRRHWAMVLLGFVHALLLFSGDILGAYVIVGLILVVALFETSVKTLKVVFWALIAYAVASGISGMLFLAQMDEVLAAAPSEALEFSLADIASGMANYGWAMLMRIGFWLVSSPTL
ncbi:MAG: hypothetical protein Q4F67_06760, partial [Propionibacteriaceae bacterium]|nr:hypothetical protein [Propionibacteriaceae bacterium]